MRLSHEPYYHDRSSVADLCCDFPADELLIEGLNGMQCYLWDKGMNIQIPVLHVMNTAHFLAAYMFGTQCSGDRIEYDMMVYDSVGRDRQLMAITLITLAAMLGRTDGMRARHCRSILLEDRNEDFYEGMNLYERFLRNSERHFEEQDFMTDMMAELTDLRQLTQQLINDKQLLQKQIKEMENQTKHIGYNVENMVINMSGGTLVQHADLVQASGEVRLQNLTDPTPILTAEDDVPEKDEYSFFGTDKFAADICEKNLRETIANAKSKADACRNIMTLDTCGYLHIRHLTDARKAELINPFAAPKYVFTEDDFKKARNRKSSR